MLTHIKSFQELTLFELYKIFKLRQNIFIIEQHIVYPDIDEKDLESVHFWIEDESSKNILSYLRMIPDEKEQTVSIGRVLTPVDSRGKGYSRLLMEAALDYAKAHYSTWSIHLHAQEYLKDFYISLGFMQTGPIFTYPDEDPVPHVPMAYRGG